MKAVSTKSLPSIALIDQEADALADLAVGVADRLPQVSELLLNEISRARIYSRAKMPSDAVTMYATVDFIDEASQATRSVQLVYPRDADISAGRISILTPIGAGLIGVREGMSILWPDREGRQRQLRVVKVVQQPQPA